MDDEGIYRKSSAEKLETSDRVYSLEQCMIPDAMDPICGRSCEASFCELNTGSCMYALKKVPYEVGNAHTTPSTKNAAISLDGECVR